MPNKMNLFLLAIDPTECALAHSDKHVVKMILEATQMLTTAWHCAMLPLVWTFVPYKATHVNHPCTIWTRQSLENYNWHLELMACLLWEYTRRYNKTHKSVELYQWLLHNTPLHFPQQGRTPFPICMKDEYKVGDDPIQSYRKYYIKDKVRFAKWEPRAETPDWFKQGVLNESRANTKTN